MNLPTLPGFNQDALNNLTEFAEHQAKREPRTVSERLLELCTYSSLRQHMTPAERSLLITAARALADHAAPVADDNSKINALGERRSGNDRRVMVALTITDLRFDGAKQ